MCWDLCLGCAGLLVLRVSVCTWRCCWGSLNGCREDGYAGVGYLVTRCVLVLEEKRKEERRVVDDILLLWEQFRDVQSTAIIPTMPKAVPVSRWQVLSMGVIKINVDGAYASRKRGFVVIVRDWEGSFLGALASPLWKHGM